MSDDLTPQELAKLTGVQRLERQAAILCKLGIPFRFGARTISVARAVAEHLPIWREKASAGPRMDLIP